jgi:hypothetical protein
MAIFSPSVICARLPLKARRSSMPSSRLSRAITFGLRTFYAQ